ncbi:hypothetical protein X758_23275 [Mesorhizobium sp. LSHC416B00]|nr:hypothetical protein X758_23275 [Mesorhizobium sp. LSHC416B00]
MKPTMPVPASATVTCCRDSTISRMKARSSSGVWMTGIQENEPSAARMTMAMVAASKAVAGRSTILVGSFKGVSQQRSALPSSPCRDLLPVNGRRKASAEGRARDCGPPAFRRPRGGPAAAAAIRPVSE